MRPHRTSAGSTLSLWLVVKTTNLSSPQQDHNPSVKFRSPESVTRLLSSQPEPENDVVLCFFDFAVAAFFFAVLSAVKSTEQSMSSITIMERFVVWIKSERSSELSETLVSSKS
ncbi:hypothetical protein KIW84_013602 [Lathyrus oleraceus]|uniref:Uncharacterized protein n=1 Tax=Pisum sativum TaxID=3888 RepID=A0A9D5BKG8_PEA|nr:hypothetical protein KIW84_013602 [Pisum sativum]